MSALMEQVRSRPKPPSPAVARAIRRSAGVTQAQVAAEIGVHPVTVARWECGTRTPQGTVLQRWMALLDELRVAA